MMAWLTHCASLLTENLNMVSNQFGSTWKPVRSAAMVQDGDGDYVDLEDFQKVVSLLYRAHLDLADAGHRSSPLCFCAGCEYYRQYLLE